MFGREYEWGAGIGGQNRIGKGAAGGKNPEDEQKLRPKCAAGAEKPLFERGLDRGAGIPDQSPDEKAETSG
mgnify:CR=1 FL=1